MPGSALRASAPTGVSDWYLAERVQGHTRLRLSRYPRTDQHFQSTSQRARTLGARVLVRHVRSTGNAPAWEREDTEQIEEDEATTLERLFAAGRSHGLRTVAYYWHISDDQAAQDHPEWLCRNAAGKTYTHRRGQFLDITGPFREEVLEDLLTIAAAGADALYFDHRHLPPGDCFGTSLEAAYHKTFGKPPPRSGADAVEQLRWRQFRAERLNQTFEYWQSQVKARFPSVMFIISAASIPGLTTPEMNTGLVDKTAAKIEFTSALRQQFNNKVFIRHKDMSVPSTALRIAAGLAIPRDASGGVPPHVWAPAFPNEDHAYGFAAAMVTHGAIANMDIQDDVLLGESRDNPGTPTAALLSAFALGARIAPYMAGAMPKRWAAVHFSEEARNRRWPDSRAAWEQVLWPFLGAYGELLSAGVPVGVVNDRQLAAGSLQQYRLLVLNGADALSDDQKRAVEAFRKAGGRVVENRSEWIWHLPGKKAAEAFRVQLEQLLNDAPVRLATATPLAHLVTHERVLNGQRELLVAMTPEFSWIRDMLPGKMPEKNLPAPPEPVTGLSLSLDRSVLGGAGTETLQVQEIISGKTLSTKTRKDRILVEIPTLGRFALLKISPAPATLPSSPPQH